MTRKIIYNKTKHRLAVLLPTVLCALWCFAQASLPERLSHVLDVQDMDLGIKLYGEITENDLNELPDSSLFHYHYLGGYLNSEIPNHDKAISHLLAAKNLCDSKLGTYSIGYMEIMHGLGDEYIEIGKHEDALAIFQEGIVKSMAIRNGATHAFANLIIGVQECYEYMGWFNEVPNHLMDAWGFWPKDDTTLETYTYYPLWCLAQFYRRYGMYDRAITVSNEIEKFIVTNGGENHPELCDALYMKGNLLRDANKYEEAVMAYERAISIAKNSISYDSELLGMLYGNLACSYIEVNDFDNCDRICELMKNYYGNSNQEYYKNLLALGILAGQHNQYDQALSYLAKAEQGALTRNDMDLLKWNKDCIIFNKGITAHFADFETNYTAYEIGTAEWFDNAHKLSCAYNLIHDHSKNLDVLKFMLDAIHSNQENGEPYILWVYNNLIGVSLELTQNDLALQYATDRLNYIESLGSVPEDSQAYYMSCLNDVVVSQLKSGKIEGIDVTLDKLRVLYIAAYGEGSKQYAIYLHNRGRAYQIQNQLEEAKETLLKAISIQNKVEGKPMERTVKYYLEVQQQLGEI